MFYGFLARRRHALIRSRSNLLWGDLDLKRGAIKLDRNKTDDPRACGFSIRPPPKRSSRGASCARGNPSDGESVFGHLPDRQVTSPRSSAKHLKIAGVTRAELFEDSDVAKPFASIR